MPAGCCKVFVYLSEIHLYCVCAWMHASILAQMVSYAMDKAIVKVITTIYLNRAIFFKGTFTLTVELQNRKLFNYLTINHQEISIK